MTDQTPEPELRRHRSADPTVRIEDFGAYTVSYAQPTVSAPVSDARTELAPVPLTRKQRAAIAKTPRLAAIALGLAVVALVSSFFFGWGIPVALAAVVVAVLALRRPAESRPVAMWALLLGLLASVFSIGWLIWLSMQLDRLG